MKSKTLFITVFVSLLLITSCSVISFYPFYTKDVLTKNDNILGKWIGFIDKDTLVWEITFREYHWIPNNDNTSKRETNEHTYTLSLYNPKTPKQISEFDLHLINLEGKLYADFYPTEYDFENSILFMHFMEVHTFAKFDISKDSLMISWLNPDWLQKKLKDNKIRIKHEKSHRVLLTAQPKELQKFIIKYADDKNAFDGEGLVLKPKR